MSTALSELVAWLNEHVGDDTVVDGPTTPRQSGVAPSLPPAGSPTKFNVSTEGAAFDRRIQEVLKLIQRARQHIDDKEEEPEAAPLVSTSSSAAATSPTKPPRLPSARPTTTVPAEADPFSNVSFAQKSKLHGGQQPRTRKPIRAILDGIQSKIQLLQSNPVEMNKFLSLIESYRLEELQALSGQDNIVQRNRDALRTYSPASVDQARQARAAAEKEKMTKALAAHTSQLNASLEATRLKVAAEDAAYEAHLKHRAQAAQLATFRQHQRKYALIVLLGSRLFLISHLLHTHHIHSLERLRQSHAARVIQRQTRIWIARRLKIRREKAMDDLSVHLGRLIRRRRQRQLNEAGDIVREFLQEAKESSRLLELIREWRIKILKGQAMIRRHLTWMHATRELMALQWEKYEPIWWDKKVRSALLSAKGKKPAAVGRGAPPSKKPTTPGSTSTKQLAGKSAPKLTKMLESKTSNIPVDIRNTLLDQHFSAKRRLHYQQFAVWYQQLQLWRKQKAELDTVRARLHIDPAKTTSVAPESTLRLKPDGSPLWLRFKPLLSEADLFSLMDQAFTLMQDRAQTPTAA